MADLTEVEQNLLVTCRRVTMRQHLPLDRKELLRHCAEKFSHLPQDLSDGFASLRRRGWIELDSNSENLRLSGEGVHTAWQLAHAIDQTEFGKWMCESECSAAYAEFCHLVYATPLVQFNMVDNEQLAELLRRLALTPESRVIDLGCGIGTQAEYISDETGAHVVGVDFAVAAVERALTRTEGKRHRLTFEVEDLDVVDLPKGTFDVALSLDTLYFVDDLDVTLGQIFASLVAGGRFAAFYSEVLRRGESREVLEPNQTRLARVLERRGCAFEWVDFTERERQLWDRYLQTAQDLKHRFEAEGNAEFAAGLIEEATEALRKSIEGRTRRYLYIARSA